MLLRTPRHSSRSIRPSPTCRNRPQIATSQSSSTNDCARVSFRLSVVALTGASGSLRGRVTARVRGGILRQRPLIHQRGDDVRDAEAHLFKIVTSRGERQPSIGCRLPSPSRNCQPGPMVSCKLTRRDVRRPRSTGRPVRVIVDAAHGGRRSRRERGSPARRRREKSGLAAGARAPGSAVGCERPVGGRFDSALVGRPLERCSDSCTADPGRRGCERRQ